MDFQVDLSGVQLVKSRSGKKLLKDDLNYVYSLNKTTENKTYWICVMKHSKRCLAKAIMNQAGIVETHGDHNHVPDGQKLKANLLKQHIIETAVENPTLAPRWLFNEMCQVPGNPVDLLLRPSKLSLTNSIKYQRRTQLNRPPVPSSFGDVMSNYPDDFKVTKSGQSFCILRDWIDENMNKALLMFMSPTGRDILLNSKIWLADGTFKAAPPPFLQIYVIQGMTSTDKVFPAAFCLLPDKTEATYERMWFQLQQDLDGYKPETLVMDMENAAFKSFMEAFPTSKVEACLFHMAQAKQRNLQTRGCIKDYEYNENFRTVVDMLYSLLYVPEDRVVEAFETVVEPQWAAMEDKDTVTPEMEDFYAYHERTYIGSKNARSGKRRPPRFPFSMTNKYKVILENRPTTNNSSEAFNYVFTRDLERNSSFWSVIDAFRREEAGSRKSYLDSIAYIRNGLPGENEGGQKVIDRRLKNQALKNILSKFDSLDLKAFMYEIMALKRD